MNILYGAIAFCRNAPPGRYSNRHIYNLYDLIVTELKWFQLIDRQKSPIVAFASDHILTNLHIILFSYPQKLLIRRFTIERKNVVLINTDNNVKVSALINSIVETARANQLNIYKY